MNLHGSERFFQDKTAGARRKSNQHGATVFDATIRHQNPAAAFLSYDEEHHRFAFVNLAILQPDGSEMDRIGTIGVDHLAYTCGSLADLFDNYENLKAGESPANLLTRTVHLPVSPVRGSAGLA